MKDYGGNRNWQLMPTGNAWGGILPGSYRNENVGRLGVKMVRAVLRSGGTVNFIKMIRYESGWLSFVPTHECLVFYTTGCFFSLLN